MPFSDMIEKPSPKSLFNSILQEIEQEKSTSRVPEISDKSIIETTDIFTHRSIKMGSHNEPQNMNLSLNPDLSLSRLAEDEAPPLPLPKDNSKKQEDGAINPWESIFNPQTTFKQNNRGELEYAGLDVSQLSLQAHVSAVCNPSISATIPNIMPSPPLESLPNQEPNVQPRSQEGHHYDILRNVLGSPLVSAKTTVSEDKDTDEKEKEGGSIKHTKNHLLKAFFSNRQDLEKSAMEEARPARWTQQQLFWAGFVCPLLWVYGSFQHSKIDSVWRKRCRFATLYFLILLALIILVVTVRVSGGAGTRQTQSDTIRAVIAE
ncbi:hypothetical protein G6F43_011148 [Rhizopus delemar]|nr:hypothetical protein G6F43_011148 [Rhizopus delemar]